MLVIVNYKKWILVGFIAVALMMAVCKPFHKGVEYSSDEKKRVYGRSQRDAMLYMTLLSELRSGRNGTAIELLEMNLDSCIVQIWEIKNSWAIESSGVDDFLGLISTYRKTYPHEAATVSDASGLMRSDAEAMCSKAKIILNRVRERAGSTQKKMVTDNSEVVGKDMSYEELRFRFDRAFLMRDWSKAERCLCAIMEKIGNTSDDRYIWAQEELVKVKEKARVDGN